MVLKVKVNDDIINNDDGIIIVIGNKNIGMRVDLGIIKIDDFGIFMLKVINKGKIIINNGFRNIGMVVNNFDGNYKVIVENNLGVSIIFKNNLIKVIGMFL